MYIETLANTSQVHLQFSICIISHGIIFWSIDTVSLKPKTLKWTALGKMLAWPSLPYLWAPGRTNSTVGIWARCTSEHYNGELYCSQIKIAGRIVCFPLMFKILGFGFFIVKHEFCLFVSF